MWIAELRESSNLWTHIALSGIPGSMPVWGSVKIKNLSWNLFLIYFIKSEHGIGSFKNFIIFDDLKFMLLAIYKLNQKEQLFIINLI